MRAPERHKREAVDKNVTMKMDFFQAVVVSVVLATSSCSHNENCPQEAPEGSLYFSPGEDICILPCHVELSEADSVSANVPHVTWLFQSKSETFVPLDDSQFWKKEYSKHYCDKAAFPFPDFRNFSGPSHFDCAHQSGNLYNCSLEQRRCFLGTYKCKVTLGPAGGSSEQKVLSEVTTDVITSPCLIIEPYFTVCFQPTVESMSAKMMPSSNKIRLSWTPTAKPTNTSCKLKYCLESRQYSAKMLVFNSMPLDDSARPDYETEWFKVKRRQTFYTFRGDQISSEKFFMFEVRNQRRDNPATTTIPYKNIVQTRASGVFYFGTQEKANLTEPSQDTVHNATFEETVRIRCSATGQPTPTVTLSHDQLGENVVIHESPSAVQLDLIVTQSAKFYCTAKNNFVNELGGIEHVVRRTAITVSLKTT